MGTAKAATERKKFFFRLMDTNNIHNMYISMDSKLYYSMPLIYFVQICHNWQPITYTGTLSSW